VLRRLAVLAVLALLLLAPAGGAVPAVDAVSYLLVNPASGEVLAERSPDRPLPMASTTKMMTAIVVRERTDPDDLITVPPSAIVGEASGELVAGERLRVRDLLTALLVASGNDAAITLADGVAGSQAAFVELMNERARELGLTQTRFANPHGLDAPGHRSSVRDLVALARAAMRDPVLREIFSARRAAIPGPGGAERREYESRNELLDIHPDADGVKTGMTAGAGYALVGHAARPALGVQLYAALIGAPSSAARARDAARLLDWGFAQYARATLLPDGAVIGRAPVQRRPGRSVPYRARAGLAGPIRLGQPVTARVVAPTGLRAPVEEGQVVGRIALVQGGRVIGRRDLVAAEGAGEPSLWDRVRAGMRALVP
jgi:serine-type D-Ala-D-Ala carboxypeptidase (penicillin-binding protein 5/6)